VTVPKFTYQPSESRYDLPEGTYRAAFDGTKERKFDQPGKYGNDGPRLEWSFVVLDGPERGKTISWTTGADPSSPKSNCFKLLKWLLSRAPNPGEDIDTEAYRGKVYEIDWEVNPNSESGNFHIARMKLAAVAGSSTPAPAVTPARVEMPANGTAAPSSRQGPPPRKAPAAAAPPARRFYVYTTQDDSGDPVTMDEKELHDYVHTSQRAPGTVTVCAVGEDEWKTALDYGIQDTIPW
jgi:hypothetical protein